MKPAVALFALMLAGCSAAPTRHSANEGPTFVSLNPCADAILAEVADPSQILAVSHYSHDPRSTSMPLNVARRFPATGGTVEEVLALAPDIVVGSTFMAPATRAAFDRLGMRVEAVGTVHTVEQSNEQVRALAALAGHPERGEALVSRIEKALAEARAEGPPVGAILWQPDGIVPGAGELVADLMRRTGFVNQSAARGMGQAEYLSLERLLADPPRVVLVSGNERGQRHAALTHIPSMTLATFDPSLVFCGGPTIVRAVERLARVRDAVS